MSKTDVLDYVPALVRPVTHVDAAVQSDQILRALETRGREDLGHTIAGTSRTAAKRRGIDPDSGLTYAELHEAQVKMKAEAAARRERR